MAFNNRHIARPLATEFNEELPPYNTVELLAPNYCFLPLVLLTLPDEDSDTITNTNTNTIEVPAKLNKRQLIALRAREKRADKLLPHKQTLLSMMAAGKSFNTMSKIIGHEDYLIQVFITKDLGIKYRWDKRKEIR